MKTETWKLRDIILMAIFGVVFAVVYLAVFDGGMALSAALQRYGLFPAELLQMISVGERTGELDGILKRSCSYFENRVERSILTVTSLLQPIILCLIGAAVGVLFYAVYSPMLQVMNSL